MIKPVSAFLGGLSLVISVSATAADAPLNTLNQKASYIMGMNLGKQMSAQRNTIELNQVIMGIQDAYNGNQLKMTQAEMQAVAAEFQKKAQEEQEKLMAAKQAQAEKNLKEGKAFLEANKKKDGVKTLASGLQYKVLKSGNGPSPAETDTVVTHYRGNLINGEVFDSSYKRGQPATFPVNGVIKGWTEALQKMKVGDKWQLFVPADLAYGERSVGQKIEPNSVLIFEIELLEIKKS